MTEHLFSYGTLQKNEVQLRLFGRLLHGTKDVLEGCKLSSIEINDEKFLASGEENLQKTLIISPDLNDKVEGTVFEITAEELLLADKYEPDNYKRVRVNLQSCARAWVYMAS